MMTPQDVLQTGTQRTIAPRTHPYSPYVQETCSQEQGTLGGPGVRGPKEGKVFWNESQAVEHTAGSQYAFLVCFCFLSVRELLFFYFCVRVYFTQLTLKSDSLVDVQANGT